MSHVIRHFFPFFLSLFAVVETSHAEVLTYREAISDAVRHSARIRVKVAEMNIADALYRQNFAGLFPEVTLNGRIEQYENLDERRNQGIKTVSSEVIGGDDSAWRSSLYLWGRYEVSNWYKKRHEVSYYEQMRDVRQCECDVETKKLLRDLTDVYGAAGGANIRLRYAAEIMKRLQSTLALKKRALAGGQVSYEEVLKTEAEITGTVRETSAISLEFKESIEILCSLAGRICGEGLEVEALVPDHEIPATDFVKWVERNPEYKVRAKELDAARTREQAAANNAWPDITLYGRYDYYGSSPNSLSNAIPDVRETAFTAGVLISLPLVDGGARHWERKKSRLEIKRQEEDVRAITQEKGREARKMLAGRAELSKSRKHYRKLLEQYGKLLDITKGARDLGERSAMDILEMEKDALAVERDLRVAEHDLAIYEKRLILEADYDHFIREYHGDGACQH
jgi:outer membrane protein TolC